MSAEAAGEQIRRSPQGERGLKYFTGVQPQIWITSLPARGAWIEIGLTHLGWMRVLVAPRKGSVD